MDREAQVEQRDAGTLYSNDDIASLIQRAWELGAHDPRQALALSEETYRKAQQQGDAISTEVLLSCLVNLGRFHYELSQLDRSQARLEEALSLVNNSAQDGEDGGAEIDHRIVSRIYMGMGLIRWRLGDYAAALERLLLALDFIRRVGDEPAEANILSNIGMVYGVIGEHQHAMNVYRQSLEIYERHSGLKGHGMALNNLAMVCIQAGEYAPALAYAQQGLKIAIDLKFRTMEVNALDSVGGAYMGLGRLQEAHDYFYKSAMLAAELGNQHCELAAWVNIGQLYERKGELEAGRAALQRALALAEELDDPEQIRHCYQELAQLFKKQGDFEQALAHYEQYHKYDQAIYRERADMRLKTLQVVHETETARREAESAQFRNAALEKEIEERGRIEAALRESENRFRLLMEESPIGVHIYAADGSLLHWNRAWREMWDFAGFSWEEYNILEGRTIDCVGVREEVERAFRGESVRILEVELNPEQLGRQRIPRWLRAHAYSLIDEENRLKNVVLMIEDITEQRRSEEAVRMAQKIESLGALAGGVAHDFNNLLVAMLGQASLAIKLLPQEHAARAHVHKVVAAAEQAADLTRQMLAYSGQGHFAINPLNLNHLLRDRASLWQAAISHRVPLQLDLKRGLPLIEADASQIQQMVLNLILNAAEASGQTGRITVSTSMTQITGKERAFWQFTSRPLEAGAYLSLKVVDEGGGIPASTLDHIFDPFFTTKEVGRGLGLAAVLGIVRGHKAGIAVYNNAGASNGATFEILFPISESERTALPDGTRAASSHHVAQGAVLVVDDEVMVLEAVADILMLENVSVLKANGGREALELYRQHAAEIGLVLLDLSMPEMSGEETFRRLRDIDPQVRVLLSSGYSAHDVAIHFDEEGPAGFLQKPYSVTELVERVRNYLQG